MEKEGWKITAIVFIILTVFLLGVLTWAVNLAGK